MGTEKWRKSSQESKIFALGGLRGVLAANPFAREVFFPRESKFAYEIALLHDYASANQLGSDDYCPALKVHAMKYNMRKLTRCWDRGGKLLRQVEHRASLPTTVGRSCAGGMPSAHTSTCSIIDPEGTRRAVASGRRSSTKRSRYKPRNRLVYFCGARSDSRTQRIPATKICT
jgi:hypothetical protein